MRAPEQWRNARVTLGIAAVTAAAWLVGAISGWSDVIAIWGGFIPARVGGLGAGDPFAPLWLTPLTATLIHAGIVHLAFNLLILLFCGRAIETILGARGLALLYLVGAYAAAAAHYLVGPEELMPMIGASGAISAVLGAYAILFGQNRVKIADPRLALWINAVWLAAAWIVLQLLIGLTFDLPGARIAYGAHIGGFLAGLLLGRPLLLLRYRGA